MAYSSKSHSLMSSIFYWERVIQSKSFTVEVNEEKTAGALWACIKCFPQFVKAESSWALPFEDNFALKNHFLPFSYLLAVPTWCGNGCFLVKRFSLYGALSSCSFSYTSVLQSLQVYSVVG